MQSKPFRLSKCLVVATMGMAGLVHAQQASRRVIFPDGLQWKMMPQVTFNFTAAPTGTPEQKSVVENIWGKELSQEPDNDLKGVGKYPSFVLLSTVDADGFKYVFTSYNSLNSTCIAPPNGPFGDPKYKAPMYSTCDLRIVRIDPRTNQRVVRSVPEFCHLYIDSPPDHFLSNNHTEIAFDSKTKTAYFRVIQYGKRAPECDRRITVG